MLPLPLVPGLLFVLCVWAPVAFAETPDPPPLLPENAVATWRDGVILRSDTEGWLAFRGRAGADADLQTVCQDIALHLALASEVEHQGIDDATKHSLEQATDALLTQRLRQQLSASVEVDPEEIEAAYQEHADAFVKPRRLRLRNLYLSFPPDPTDDEKEAVRRTMHELLERIASGESFAEVAREASHSQTRFQGGMMGNIVPGQLPPKIEAIADGLQPGDTSPVIEGRQGLTILHCDAILPASNPAPDEVRARLETNLRRIESKERMQALEADIGIDPVKDKERFNQVAAVRARRMELDRDPETANALRWTRLQLLAVEGLRRRVEKAVVEPTNEAVRAHFDANRNRYTAPGTISLSVIRMDFDDATHIERYREAFRLSDALRSGQADFQEAARDHSDDPSGPMGGRWEPLNRHQIASRGPAFSKAVSDLDVGEISREFEANGRYWILRLDARKPGASASFETVRDQVRAELTRSTVAEVRSGIEAALIEEFDVALVEH